MDDNYLNDFFYYNFLCQQFENDYAKWILKVHVAGIEKVLLRMLTLDMWKSWESSRNVYFLIKLIFPM